ncbi:MAG: NAD(P)-dependent oxidoreductase [Planctomycetota bacterium]|nr:MAG: NAD(P)-dependent oxidoreductase [Planctomycetota bacterium]
MASTSTHLPERIEDIEQLEYMISQPAPYVLETLKKLPGDVIVLGAGGKMGPSLSRMIKRAFEQIGSNHRVIGVSLFPSKNLESQMNAWGIETIDCDLTDIDRLNRLPDAPNVIYMVGMKFGSTENEPMTWALNTLLPVDICRKYRNSRIVAFSTGNIYGMVPVAAGGSREPDPPNPDGEYAMSCLGRERAFEYFSETMGIPISIIRLNYSIEMRYGVLVDLAQQVFADKPIDVSMGNVNVIWQADANAMAIASLAHASSPSFILNVTGPEILSVRQVCEGFGRLMNKKVEFVGREATDALLNNAQKAHQLFGPPRVGIEQMMKWIADWVSRGGETLGKPTHFEARDGKF